MENFPFEYCSDSPESTRALGFSFAGQLHRGAVVALQGPLGSGKTCFTQGLAAGLGIEEPVTSPTYTIIAEYSGTMPLYHIDAYRLRDEEDFFDLGVEEILYGTGVTVIEWSERIPGAIPHDAFFVAITIVDSTTRNILIRGGPA
jgi:tRNA threonylcarbamoyladenosine biosynthesis protein TsaE